MLSEYETLKRDVSKAVALLNRFVAVNGRGSADAAEIRDTLAAIRERIQNTRDLKAAMDAEVGPQATVEGQFLSVEQADDLLTLISRAFDS